MLPCVTNWVVTYPEQHVVILRTSLTKQGKKRVDNYTVFWLLLLSAQLFTPRHGISV